ncbi:tRNA 2-selenouridine(34) synthase MnmH [Marinilabilia rubra]|uniref:tRNA 2-selenouridine(34) synthase MnmH n=1 Tax=Marinilabilia rubra TaxID=2162893 RepID=A0A2U2B4X6_9BACT|nr:tRNA 2-selenouridine(34) synthase MnmH [Marinilabilia rubra]PWD98112.1 tRNA 2-selenouridine(34) synthase MnmH [Marinilabilia rubra]
MPESSSLSPANFLKASGQYPVVDVRTPGEFAQGHIPGAINMPIFSNEERAEVGTLYKKEGRNQAVLKGLEFVGPKMAGFAREAARLAVEGSVLVHCWRGGMRSGSMAWLFRTAGLKASVLEGGYKAYRAHFRSELESKNWNFVVIGGPTGSGKTEVLDSLAEKGEQVLDLEGLANHKGSAFGALGQEEQPTTEQFENDIHERFRTFKPEKIIWVEGESHFIGKVSIPDLLFNKMMEAPLVMYELARELRIERLVKEYGCFKNELLCHSVLKIQKRLGGLRTRQAMKALDEYDYHKVADITLQYYDKGYANSLSKRNEPVVVLKEAKDDPVQVANKLINTFSHAYS